MDFETRMVTALGFVAMLATVFAIYYVLVADKNDNNTNQQMLPDLKDFKSANQDDAIVNQDIGENKESIKDAPPEFTSPVLSGYECLRCSDSGAKDRAQDPLDPVVSFQCPPSAMNWTRGGEETRLMFETRHKAFGNYASYYALPENTPDPMGFCRQKCEEFDGQYGKCKATTFDKNKNVCRFFYACDQVKASKDSDTYILNFDKSAQPEVIKSSS